MNYITISPQRARVLCNTEAVKSGSIAHLTNSAQLHYVSGEYRIYSQNDVELEILRLKSPNNGKL